MILRVRSTAANLFAPMIRALVEQEQGIGDRDMKYERVMMSLMAGRQHILAIYHDENAPIPIAIVLYAEVEDYIRDSKTLALDNLFIPDLDVLQKHIRNMASDISEFKTFLASYKRVVFYTKNLGLIKLLRSLGLELVPQETLYEIEVPNG